MINKLLFRMHAAFVGIAILALPGGAARAGIVMDVASAIEGGYGRITLSFTASDGVVGGFAGLFDGEVGFQGDLRQELAYGVAATPTADFNSTLGAAFDTQFLIGGDEILSAVAPFETSSTLGGAFTPRVASRAQRMDMIQLVVPIGRPLEYNFAIAEAVGYRSEVTEFAGQLLWDTSDAGLPTPRFVPRPVFVADPPPTLPRPAPPLPPVTTLPPLSPPPFVPPPVNPPPSAGPADPVRAPITMDVHSTVEGGYGKVVFSFQASEGVIGGFAGNLPGGVGFQGELNQELFSGVISSATVDLNALRAPDAPNLDTQFLVEGSDILSAIAPFESTTTLGGAFTPMVHARAEQMDLIQLVVPVGSPVEYDFAISQAIGDTADSTNFAGQLVWNASESGELVPTLVPDPVVITQPPAPAPSSPPPVETPPTPPFAGPVDPAPTQPPVVAPTVPVPQMPAIPPSELVPPVAQQPPAEPPPSDTPSDPPGESGAPEDGEPTTLPIWAGLPEHSGVIHRVGFIDGTVRLIPAVVDLTLPVDGLRRIGLGADLDLIAPDFTFGGLASHRFLFAHSLMKNRVTLNSTAADGLRAAIARRGAATPAEAPIPEPAAAGLVIAALLGVPLIRSRRAPALARSRFSGL